MLMTINEVAEWLHISTKTVCLRDLQSTEPDPINSTQADFSSPKQSEKREGGNLKKPNNKGLQDSICPFEGQTGRVCRGRDSNPHDIAIGRF